MTTQTVGKFDAEAFLRNMHVWGAAIGIALQPISTATGNIGFGIAVACTLPRTLRVMTPLRELMRQGWMRLLLAWLAWSWLSLSWSPDRAFGIEQYRATRVLLWIPLLWPIRNEWKLLVGAILAGTTLMALGQASQVRFSWPEPKYGMGSGWTTPTQTGLWAAVALSFWLIITVSTRLSVAFTTLPLAALSGLGLVWSATRASVVGLLAELLIANVVLALTSRGWLLRAMLRCLVGASILAVAMLFAGSYLQKKVAIAVTQVKQSVQAGAGVTSEIRLAMWEAVLPDFWKAPVRGQGIGAIPSVMRATTMTHPDVDMKSVKMIHSTYIQTLIETGLVGLGLLLASIGLLLRDVLRGLRGQPMLVASFGALVVWLVAAAFDGYQQSGGFLTVGAILIPLALADLRKHLTAAAD
jgi:O-antigen ligase